MKSLKLTIILTLSAFLLWMAWTPKHIEREMRGLLLALRPGDGAEIVTQEGPWSGGARANFRYVFKASRGCAAVVSEYRRLLEVKGFSPIGYRQGSGEWQVFAWEKGLSYCAYLACPSPTKEFDDTFLLSVSWAHFNFPGACP